MCREIARRKGLWLPTLPSFSQSPGYPFPENERGRERSEGEWNGNERFNYIIYIYIYTQSHRLDRRGWVLRLVEWP